MLGPLLAGCAGHSPSPPGASAPVDREQAYQIEGEWYYPLKEANGYVQRGKASWYGGKFHGRRTANGEIYDMHQPTAAHRTLPLPTLVQVTNLENGRTTRVRVNDRGPFVDTHERIIDLSFAAAQRLGMDKQGVAPVEVRAIAGPEELGDREPTNPDRPASAGQSVSGKPRSPEAAPAGDDTLYLQVGAFQNQDNAARLKQRVRRTELGRVVVTTGHKPSGPIYRVRVGPLDSILHADRLAQKLRRQGIESGHVVRE
jgi:rare lipoprotein A